MASYTRKRNVFSTKRRTSDDDDDDDDDDQIMWNANNERKRKDSGFYADFGNITSPTDTSYSSSMMQGGNLQYAAQTNDDDDVYDSYSNSGDDEQSSDDNMPLPLSTNASKNAGFSHRIPPSPPPSPPLRHRRRKSSYTPRPKLHPQLPSFTRKSTFLPSPMSTPPPREKEKTPLSREIAFVILFSCISCISSMIIPPSSTWIRFLYSIGGVYFAVPTILTISLIWGVILNSVREYIGALVSTKEFLTIVVLLSNTYFAIRGIPHMFLFLDQVRQSDVIGIGSLSVWSVLSSTTVAAFMLGTLMLALLAVEVSLLVYRLISPLLA